MEKISALHFVIEGSFCSFRDPNGAKYQQTYWFPPKTTIVGFLGCAMGLEPPQLEPLYDQLHVGVVLESWQGIARDLWGYTKLKGSAKPESAVVIRELLYQPHYAIFVAAAERTQLEELQNALVDPVFPLRFGRGEDLAMLRARPKMVDLGAVNESPWLRWTILPFTLQERQLVFQTPLQDPPPRRPPIPSRMPIRFRYDKNWVRVCELSWATQVFDWAVKPAVAEGLWTDGQHTFYLV